MRCRPLFALAVLAILLTPAASTGKPSPSQKLFRKMLLDDARVTPGIKRLLRSNAGIVDPRSGFVDVTGDAKQDALVFVTTNGAAGSVALYVFSTHGAKEGADGKAPALRLVYRNQSLYRATLRLHDTTVTLIQPKYAEGDDLCCPAKVTERDYVWTEDKGTFTRAGETRESNGPGALQDAPPAPAPGA